MTTSTAELDLDDIQAACVRGRPNPYTGAFIGLRIVESADGRALMRRLAEVVHAASDVVDPATDATFSVGLTANGLRALGVPENQLGTFAPQFVAGMVKRADALGDTGVNSPQHWEAPWRTEDRLHVMVVLLAPTAQGFTDTLSAAHTAMTGLPGVQRIWHQDVSADDQGRNSFGFADGISQPAIDGSGVPGTNPHEQPLKAGEFITGYIDETGSAAPVPEPAELGRNGSYLAVRKLYTDVAAFRRYLREQAGDPDQSAVLAAKIMGRWPSGAPLALRPESDDPDLGADPARNNAFTYAADADGLACPAGSHTRRMNARDSVITGDVRLHRLLRRSATYGPALPDDQLKDDGVDRGLIFAALFANPARQFEFVQKQWIGDGRFIGTPQEADPLTSGRDTATQFTVPWRPIRKRLTSLPAFVVNRGGEYCFVPSISGLRWLGGMETP